MLSYEDLVSLTLKTMFPAVVMGDGNCLFRSFSLAIFGTEDRHIELRARAVMELVLNEDHYLRMDTLANALLLCIALTQMRWYTCSKQTHIRW